MANSLAPPVLNPSSLYTEEARRDATRIRIYNSVLQQIYNKIKSIARIPGNEKSLWYIVPEFIPGTPRFDIGDAILYLVWNLRNIGYTVEYTHPNLLFISWRSHDEKYRRQESPWTKVLNAARTNVVTTAAPTLLSNSTTIPTILRKAPSDVVKRQTPLKKTVEFKPTAEVVPSSSNPTITNTMYGALGATQPSRLPGQLSSTHVSFV
jgi:hypothetical protein